METKQAKKWREQFDLRTIKAIIDQGANLSKPHSIEHHFIVTNEQNIAKMSEILKREGYEVYGACEDIDEDGKKYFFFDACKVCLIEPNTIFAQTKQMTEIASSFKESYDGWGTFLEDVTITVPFKNF